eukprot:8222517-Karenia_brevis.AAC.1
MAALKMITSDSKPHPHISSNNNGNRRHCPSIPTAGMAALKMITSGCKPHQRVSSNDNGTCRR